MACCGQLRLRGSVIGFAVAPGAVAGQVTCQMIAGGLELIALHAQGRHQPDPEVELGIVGGDFLVAGEGLGLGDHLPGLSGHLYLDAEPLLLDGYHGSPYLTWLAVTSYFRKQVAVVGAGSQVVPGANFLSGKQLR